MSWLDINVPAQPDRARWSETRLATAWNSAAGAGIYIHTGRLPSDLHMWWAQVAAYLPDGQLCVNRIWGRNASNAGIATAGLNYTVLEEGWTSALDSVGQLTTTTALTARPQGAGGPSVPLRWEAVGTAAAPYWDMYGDEQESRLSHAGDAHNQRAYRTSGTLCVAGREYPLDGVGMTDHSSGVRALEHWYRHRFLVIVAADWVAHLIGVDTAPGTASPPVGAFYRDGDRHGITRFELPHVSDPTGGPIAGRLDFATATGESFSFDTTLEHALPVTFTNNNDNINGVDWDDPGNPVICIEGQARLTDTDGTTVAHCFHERSARRDALPPNKDSR